MLSLQPSGPNVPIDSEGKFEVYKILPGEYTLTVFKTIKKDGKAQTENTPFKITIENEKTSEVNLDEPQKK